MARGDQLGRQWKILQMLIDAKTGRSVAGIADRLCATSRAVILPGDYLPLDDQARLKKTARMGIDSQIQP